MKPDLKYLLLFIAVQLFALGTFAQGSNKSFVGIWELTTIKSDGGVPTEVPPGVLKIFNADGTFTNVQVQQTGSVITHGGKFVVNDDRQYTETIKNEINTAEYALAGKTYKIRYVFGLDKKTLKLDGTVDGKNGQPDLAYTEVWRKL
jgi:sugar (pentulose or hexulose) kinase